MTQPYYGRRGQQLIDPIVFFKLCLVGYLENFASDRKDSRCLTDLFQGLTHMLQGLGFRYSALLADTGYSTVQNYDLLEREGLTAFIPAHGAYTGDPEGFAYDKEGDYWLCPACKKVTFCQEISKTKAGQLQYRLYWTSCQDCKDCPWKAGCYGKNPEKRITITSYRDK